jgi:hypothetical protein
MSRLSRLLSRCYRDKRRDPGARLSAAAYTQTRRLTPRKNSVRTTGRWQGLAPRKPEVDRVAETAILLMQRFGWGLSRYVEDYLPDPFALLHVLEGRCGLFEREGLVGDRAQTVLCVSS